MQPSWNGWLPALAIFMSLWLEEMWACSPWGSQAEERAGEPKLMGMGEANWGQSCSECSGSKYCLNY